jgi:Mor family transcriptional regulator
MSKRPGPRSDNREALDRLFHRLRADFGPASGQAIIKTIIEELGGLRVSIPGLDDLYREERDSRINTAFNGRNYEELAIRWGLSIRQVRYIIDGEPAHRHREDPMD